MLTPAVDAYGWPFVALVLVIVVLSLVALVLDFRRFARDWDRKGEPCGPSSGSCRTARRSRGRHAPTPGG